jgi:hypothetical protein
MRQECHRIVHSAPRRQSSGTDRRTYLAWLKVNRRHHRLGLGGPFPTPLSTPLRPAQGAIGRATLDEVTLGEHRHLVLQALCRGSVRRCQGTECAPCDAYIIAATRSGIPAALPDIFPGCRVVRWQPVQKALSGKVKRSVWVQNWVQGQSCFSGAIGKGRGPPFKAVSSLIGGGDVSIGNLHSKVA